MLDLKYIIDYGIVSILLLSGFISLWIFTERLIFYFKIDLKKYKNKNSLEIDLEKGLTLIATIGSSAPYIGLLGTVFAIMLTFYEIGDSMDTKAIMIGLALALKATAIGLLVAIPSIIFYNILSRKTEIFIKKWEILNEKI